MKEQQPPSGAAGIPLRELTDEQPIVIHGPLQGEAAAHTGQESGPAVRLHTGAEREQETDDHVGGPGAGEPPAAVATEPMADVARSEGIGSPEGLARERAVSLDALRGFFLVVMTLGFTIQGRIFPDWMYHRQFPPPGDLVPVAGLTWRDLAYAAFLFTMAAALPITLSRRIERGETELATMLAIVRRFLLLFMFALLIGHANTFFIGYTQQARLLALAGFVIMFAVFTRRRPDWNETWFRVLRRVGWLAAIAFLLLSPTLYDSSFSPARRDDIIAGLAFAALSGSVIWYFTRDNLGMRLAILAATVALYLGARADGWIQEWWWSSPAPWLMRPSSLVLLAVVIPGTIAGDLLLRWMRAAKPTGADGWSRLRLTALLLICTATAPVTVIGLYNRWVLLTTQVVVAMCAAGVLLTHRPRRPGDVLVRQLFLWASLWLIVGLLLDPAEGGIRKVPETLSYFFTVTGVTMMLLVVFAISADLLRKTAWAGPLIAVGHNPMLAYVTYTVFLNSLFELYPPLRSVLRASPGESLLRSLLMTVLVIVIVQAFTRRRIFWRT